MTREKLGQYINLKREIKLLENNIKELNNKEACYSNDVVKGSSVNFPYTEHPIKLYGYDSEYEEKMIKSIQRKNIRLKNLKLECEEEAEIVFEFINTQKDSRTRQVLTYTFINGYKQEKTAKIMFIDRSLVSKIISDCIK